MWRQLAAALDQNPSEQRFEALEKIKAHRTELQATGPSDRWDIRDNAMTDTTVKEAAVKTAPTFEVVREFARQERLLKAMTRTVATMLAR